MTIRDAFDFLYTDESFVPGTRAVTVQEDYENTPNGTWYLSRRFHFPPGEYVFKLQVDDGASVWLGKDALSTNIIMRADIGTLQGTDQVQLHLDGDYRIDVILTNLSDVPSPAFFALNITRPSQTYFYASNKEGWRLDDVPIADADLEVIGDYRFELPVFTVLPNWKNGITERLSWETDVLSSESEAEQRRSVRRHPRRSFEAEFLRAKAQRTRLDNFFVGVGKSRFMMPLWHEQLRIITGISIEAPSVIFEGKDTVLREFREGDLVFINNGDPDDYDVLKIANVEDDRFDWETPPLRSWPANTRIYPMREVRLLEDPQMANYTDSVGDVRARFDLIEPDVRIPSWGEAVSGEPFLQVEPNWDEQVRLTYSRRNYALDNTSGVINVTDTGRYSTGGMQFNATVFGREQAYAFRQFLAAARGRARHFFAPSFTHDMHPVADIFAGDQQIVAQPTGYPQYMTRPQPLRLTMAIYLKRSVDPVYRQIIGAESIYARDQFGELLVPARVIADLFTFDTPLPAINLDEIKRISFVTESRFDQDSFELHHSVDGQRSLEIALTLRQAQNPRKVTA